MHAVLRAAVAEFEIKGFHGASTRDIARRAGLSPAAVYQHYATKEDLLFAIAKLTHHTALTRMQDAATLGTNPADKLRAIVSVLTTFHAQASVLTRISNNELHCLKPAHRQVVFSMRQAIQSLIRETLAEGVRIGAFNIEGLNMMTNAILSMATGVPRWFTSRGPLTAQDIGVHYGALAVALAAHSGPKATRESGPRRASR
jgi:AcrR family transcriptional regulator